MAWSRLNKYERRFKESQRAIERNRKKEASQRNRDALKARREKDLAKRKSAGAYVHVPGEEVRLQDTELWQAVSGWLAQVSASLVDRLKDLLTRGKSSQ